MSTLDYTTIISNLADEVGENFAKHYDDVVFKELERYGYDKEWLIRHPGYVTKKQLPIADVYSVNGQELFAITKTIKSSYSDNAQYVNSTMEIEVTDLLEKNRERKEMICDIKKEYSDKFDELRKARVETSYYKYGPAAENFGQHYVDALGSMQKCIQKYKETGNTEYLCDAANYVMFEYMYPAIAGAHFRATDSGESAGIVGLSVKEAEQYDRD